MGLPQWSIGNRVSGTVGVFYQSAFDTGNGMMVESLRNADDFSHSAPNRSCQIEMYLDTWINASKRKGVYCR
jgi:hypothetical protein